jgi:ArsR family transcriptional regulator, virulence genes transcriptional regulator
MNVIDLDQVAESASELLKALSNPVRLKILCQLIEGELSVGEIAGRLAARDTLVSQHLSLLRKDRLVKTRREGQTIFYAIDSPAALRLIRVLHEIFCAAAISGDKGSPRAA